MDKLPYIFAGAVITGFAGIIVRGIAKFFKSRVHFSGPEARHIKKMDEKISSLATLSDILLKVQRPQMDALIALLEATQGNNNGNVSRALCTMREARTLFDAYLIEEATVGGCIERDG